MALVAASLAVGAAHARELPPLTHSRCHAIAVNQGFKPEPVDEYGRAVVRIGRETLEMDWNGYLENVVELDGTEAEARRLFELESFDASKCEDLIGVTPR